ncbi:SDR family NAD(P)-dependent oxidoreductase [Mycolicibacterium sphagni]|uniref:Short-chain dehydrogenase n=1 Tax=Mycolicibacterium sphagni TaxID=1786 RepID=A0A255DC64_9MYCO|nr:SDR family NAD(P)-dependent oxidoreductase [Mycolicibacterium sphagni]OYN76211.1 short-chain dehydrogenase [Mycolicibacterium sphagni]
MTDPPELRFDGRIAIVTGAGGGLGREHALLLAARGATVVVNDPAPVRAGVDRRPANSVVAEIVDAGGSAVANLDSVADRAGAANLVSNTISEFGRLDILINNAGILRDSTFHKMSDEQIDAVLDVHLRGAMWISRPAFAHMREQGYGRILVTTSAAGLFGNFGQANYCAAKAGLVGFARALAQEGRKKGVTANILAPVACTAMTEDILGPLAQRLDPALVAPVAAWLVHEDCALNGEILSAFGGRVARAFTAIGPGVFLDEPTIEAIRDNEARILAEDGYTVPRNAAGELGLLPTVAG